MGKYRLASFIDHKDKFSFGNVKVSAAGATHPAGIAYADACYTLLQKSTIKIDATGETRDTRGAAAPMHASDSVIDTTIADDEIPF